MGSGLDMMMTWYTHTIQADQVWVLVRYIANLFKLASLAFAAPLIALLVFDFCLWIWRLSRPSGTLSNPPVPPYEQRAPYVAPTDIAATTSSSAGQPSGGSKRPGFAAPTDT